MNIGLIIHSQTGHTLTVAERLKTELTGMGHEVDLVHLLPDKPATPGKLSDPILLPSLQQYDGIVFGSHAEGLSLAPAMKRAMDAMPSLAGKKVACLVTQYFRQPWLGGSRSVKQMSDLCSKKNGIVKSTATVQWKAEDRVARIEKAVSDLSRSFD
jgi:NAD(P)H dehydrogenase (quinone)